MDSNIICLPSTSLFHKMKYIERFSKVSKKPLSYTYHANQ